ncbi:EAL domain-containing protein [Methylopila sp. 73B]|uniref:putative bifunctional diguanylate cyclase/phosphodiesterase n=1 Tax=Methylopila sp. 73B TaxID=1120792 RepID=UPI000462FF8A|nr:EAL domain-containing protein [Methylopila sp. 73B]
MHLPRSEAVDPTEAAYLRAVIEAYSRQVPVLYVILTISAVALAASHLRVAPLALAVAAPAALIAICALRIVIWARRRNRPMDYATACKALRTANILGPLLGAAFLGWALALFQYGDPFLQAHVIFFCGFTVVSCIFCQLHARTAALGVTLAVVPALTLFLLTRGEPTLVAIGVNLALVSAAMVRMLFVHSRSFREMILGQLETKRLSDDNYRLANLDSLTALPNRRRFFARLDESIEAKGSRGRFVVGVIDLDGFKPINDLYGHIAGDKVLIEVGARLAEAAGDDAFISRLGGDEFAVIFAGRVSDAEALGIAERMCAALQAPFALQGVSAKISASVGLVSSDQCGDSAKVLYERADYALYFAKGARRGRPVIFSAEHETAIRRFNAIEQALMSADIDREFSLNYQPIVDAYTGKVSSLEALARWTSPTAGPVSPADFIPIAERSDLINRLTQTLLRRALADAAAWPDHVGLSFNLSARDLSPEAMLGIIGLVRGSGVDPRRLVFEITETAAMRDFALAEGALNALRALGAGVALDDFGAGHSSLTYVRLLPLDEIKIDRGFILDIERDPTSRDITKSMVDLCRNLKLACVIEGVETESQRDILAGLGCRLMQGYLFSHPLKAEDIPLRLGDALLAA